MRNLEEFGHLSFEDCEVDLVAFVGSDVRVNVVNPYDNSITTLLLGEVMFFISETEHVQNVITSIFVFRSVAEAIAHPDCYGFITKRNIKLKGGNGIFVYFRPNTGFECFVECKELDWSKGR